MAPEEHILDVNFSVGVRLEINLSPRHIRSGTVLKYVQEDGEGRERAEMRPLGGAGRVSRRVPTALLHLAQPGPVAAHTAPCSLLSKRSLPPMGEGKGRAARARLRRTSADLHGTLQHTRFIICPLFPSPVAVNTLQGSTEAPWRGAPLVLAGGVGPLTNAQGQGLPPFQM